MLRGVSRRPSSGPSCTCRSHVLSCGRRGLCAPSEIAFKSWVSPKTLIWNQQKIKTLRIRLKHLCPSPVFVGLTLLTLLLIASPVAVKALPNSYSPHIPHQPIIIDGNGGFTLDNGVEAGNGTISNPYVIEGLEISQGSLVCAFYDARRLRSRT